MNERIIFQLLTYTDDVDLSKKPKAKVVPIDDPAADLYYYFHTDHLGTPYAFTDSNKNVAWQISLDPFGETVLEVMPPQNDETHRFPGQYFDRGSGLNYNWQRYYQPKIGGYYQKEPIIHRGVLNIYSYASSNPFLVTDETGLQPHPMRRLISPQGFLAGITTGWAASLQARKWQKEHAEEILKIGKTGSLGWHNGPPDAIRHCYWHCSMTQIWGAKAAYQAGLYNEMRLPGNPKDEEHMDLYNNQNGIEIAQSCPARGISPSDHCLNGCDARWRAGLLIVLPPDKWSDE